MIKILKKVEDLPYKNFYNFYEEASKKNQKSIEAIAVSSYLDKKKEVNSRFVNLKYIDDLRVVDQKYPLILHLQIFYFSTSYLSFTLDYKFVSN